MDRDTIRNALLAIFGVIAVTLTAATLPSAFQPERSGGGRSGATGTGDGRGAPAEPAPFEASDTVIEIPFVRELAILLFVVAGLVTLWYLYQHRRAVFRGIVVVLVLAIVGSLLFQLFSPRSPTVDEPPVPSLPNATSSGGASGEAVTDPPVLILVFVLVLSVAILGTAVAVRQRESESSRSAADDDTSTEAAAVARAAGRAADRIEDGDDVDNEVYRAWREMTSLLDLSRPETNTAGEFAAAAVDAGMDAGDVSELTRLFETVRYGEYEPQPADEERAVELLRRIEARYSEGES